MGQKSNNKFFRFIKYFLLIIVVILAIGYIYFSFTYPRTSPSPEINISVTPTQLERGKYLANNVCVCIACHSARDWKKFSGPVIPGTEGMGGDEFRGGFPGTFYAGNITPAGIGEWSDGDLLRSITTGVARDGRVLYPLMPYPGYRNLTIDDLNSVIGYIRSLDPVINEVPQSSVDFPMNFIIKTITLESYKPVISVNESNSLEYGKYLVNIAGCKSCHTPIEHGKFDNTLDFAGGSEFDINNIIIRSANITPDVETGIGSWTREDFLNRFKQFNADNTSEINKVQEFNTPMPWTAYSGMTDKDLNAIYDYIKTVPPVHNKVEK